MKRLLLMFTMVSLIALSSFGQDILKKMIELKLPAINDYEHLIFDYNEDDKVDLLVFIKSVDSIRFYKNNGNEYTKDFDLLVHPYSNAYFHGYYGSEIQVYYQDIDKDGLSDLIIYAANHQDCGSNNVRIYWGTPDVFFDSYNFIDLPVNAAYCVGAVLVDFNNDEQVDVFIRSASGVNTMLKNEGNRIFTNVPTFATGRDINPVFYDVDGDGLKDLIYGKNGWADGQFGFRFNKGLGNGDFDPATKVYFQDEHVSDFNFCPIASNPRVDNVMDFAFIPYNDGTNRHTLYLAKWNSGVNDFEFTTTSLGDAGSETTIVTPVDYNGDGFTDIIYRYINNPDPPYLYTGCALLNDGYGNFNRTDTIIKNSRYMPQFFKPDPDHRFYMGLLKNKDSGNIWEYDSLIVVRLDKFYHIADSISVADDSTTYTHNITIPVSNHAGLKAIDEVKSFRFLLDYDKEIVQYTDYNLAGTIIESGNIEITESIPGKLNIHCTTLSPITGTGTLLNLVFKPLKPGNSSLNIADFYFNADTIRQLKNGSIEVLFQGIQTIIYMHDTIVQVGNEVKMPVFTQYPLDVSDMIYSYEFNLEYDSEVINYVNSNLEQTIVDGGILVVTENSPGFLSIRCDASGPISGIGALLNLYFSPLIHGISPLKLNDVLFNYDTIQNYQNGSIEVLYQNMEINIPASFTPNADGINDYFEFLTEGIDSYSIWLKDTWGVLVYEYDQATGKWDGLTQSGKEAPAGPYYYHIAARDYTGMAMERSGVVYLIRELIELSPNPAKDKLVIKMNGRLPGERSVRVVSANGTVVSEQILPRRNECQLDISRLKSGFYMLVISNGIDSQSISFIKE